MVPCVILCYVIFSYVILSYVSLCYRVLSYVILCNIMVSFVILCYLMLSCVIFCYLVLTCVILGYHMLSYVILCYLMLSYLILCCIVLSYVILCYHMLSYVILCYFLLSYVILSYFCCLLLFFVTLWDRLLSCVIFCYLILSYVIFCFLMFWSDHDVYVFVEKNWHCKEKLLSVGHWSVLQFGDWQLSTLHTPTFPWSIFGALSTLFFSVTIPILQPFVTFDHSTGADKSMNGNNHNYHGRSEYHALEMWPSRIWRCAHPHAISSIQKNSPNLWVSNIAALLSSTWSTSFSAVPMQTYKQLHCTCPSSAFKRSWTQWTSIMSFNPEAKKKQVVCAAIFPGAREQSAGKHVCPSLNLARISLSWSIPSGGHKRCTQDAQRA